MTYKIAFTLIAVAGLAACEQPEDLTLNRADYRAFAADDEYARDRLSITPAGDIPTGKATYEGHIRSEATLNGEDDYLVLGLLDLTIDISDTSTTAGSGDVRGSISEVNLLDNNDKGFEDQAFSGNLTVSGRVVGGQIDARADGVLKGVLSDDVSRDSNGWDLTLEGNLRDDDAEVATGTIYGGTDGTTDDYNIQLQGGGRFYAERD
ncbi:hypothetical protein FHS72_000327 [Loktanella ponticola]|uniref:Uncharacterized protein n=1 Tax=Yoonia ponticola TaxID=1524255 RepID=A0A7W9BHL9_9RHOB|nr:hypothetical protein [Yoonia ponticola]MBB5720723.1 hypothetical protein [Yoonia ponticola]